VHTAKHTRKLLTQPATQCGPKVHRPASNRIEGVWELNVLERRRFIHIFIGNCGLRQLGAGETFFIC
jgi:hypothetical protein